MQYNLPYNMIGLQLPLAIFSCLLFNTINGDSALCQFSNTQCMTRAENRIKGALLDQFSESGDPLYQDTVSHETDDLSYTLNNIILEGLNDCEIIQVDCDTSASTFVKNIYCPKLNMIADFECSGTIGSYEIEGTGKCVVSPEDYLIQWSGEYEEVVSDDVAYVNLKNTVADISALGLTTFKLVKLYTGDKTNFALANEYLNENCVAGEELFRPAILSGINKYLEYYSAAVSKTPVDILFPAK